jgi:glycosyltransferase involved in cell wall biosynthesis
MGERLPLNVAIDATAIGSGRGGDETLLRGMLLGLAEVATDARFRLFVRPGAPLPAPVLESGHFSVHVLDQRSRAVRYAWDLPRGVAAMSPRPRLLYTQTHAAPFSRVPGVLQLTDLSFHHHPELYPPLTRLRLNTLVPLQARRAGAVFVISEFTRRDVVSTFGLPDERVFVIPCAVESRPRRRVEDPSVVQARLAELGVRQPFILFVGNLHPRKNPRRLLEAFAKVRRGSPELAQHQLVLAGTQHGFYPRLWQSGEAERIRESTGGMVIATGAVSDEMRDRLLAAADVLAYPSLFEGFGLPPVEAMAVGTPVLASNTSALPEVLGDAALLVDPYDVDAIGRGLVELVTRRELRETLRERGFRRAALYATRRCGELASAAFEEVSARVAGVQSRSMPGSSAIRPNHRQKTVSSLVSLVTAPPAPSPHEVRTPRARTTHTPRPAAQDKARHTT